MVDRVVKSLLSAYIWKPKITFLKMQFVLFKVR